MSNAKRHIQIPTSIKALTKLSFSKKLFTKNFGFLIQSHFTPTTVRFHGKNQPSKVNCKQSKVKISRKILTLNQ